MAVRVRTRLCPVGRSQAKTVETVALANSGFESAEPEALLPVRLAERLGLWPPPPGARAERFESPAATFTMLTVRRAVRISVAGTRRRGVLCHAVISERETEVVLNDRLLGLLAIALVDVGRGLYRVGRRGRLLPSEQPEHW